MHSSAQKTFQLILLALLLCFQISNGDHVSDSCSDSAKYKSGSQFASNLDKLLRSLVANGPHFGFYNNTVGRKRHQAYGLVQCRSDISGDVCASCLNISSSEIVQRCPNKKSGYMRFGYDKYGYDYCLLRYSDKSFFSMLSSSPYYYSFDGNLVSDRVRFDQVVDGLMTNLSNHVDPAKGMFAAGETRFTAKQKIYGMVQCTGDLSENDCRRCVRVALSDVPSCCDGKQGVQLFNPSCIIRYEGSPFVKMPQSPPPAREN